MNYRVPHRSHSGRAPPARHPGHSQGFTLLELLIAVAVFAVVAVTVYTRSGDTLVQLQMLEQRTLASWIAQNELALARTTRPRAPLIR